MDETAPKPQASVEEALLAKVCTELSLDTLRRRPQHVNTLLRLSMLSGVQMHLDATLASLCDYARQIVSFDHVMVYFWNELEEQSQLRIYQCQDAKERDNIAAENILDFWSRKHGQPMLVRYGQAAEADVLLEKLQARSALTVPLFVNNRNMGSMQLFSARENAYTQEDAQLLLILARVSENLLSREYANQGLIRFAFTDHLTGLKTRGYFEQQLELEIKRSDRKSERFALLMLDIDHFKALNDTYGHNVGDQVLREVAAVLMKDMREVDTVARYGGEEFVIILPETTEEEAFAVAQRIRKAVEQAKFSVPKARESKPGPVKKPAPLSISIGIAVFDQDAIVKRELVELADAALYFAKSQGRNRVILYSEMMKQQRREVS